MWLVCLKAQDVFIQGLSMFLQLHKPFIHLGRTLLVPVLEFGCFLFSPKKVIYIAKQFLALAGFAVGAWTFFFNCLLRMEDAAWRDPEFYEFC